MKTNKDELDELSARLIGREKEIVEKLGNMILTLGDIKIGTGIRKKETTCYDLTFIAIKKKYKPSFCTFITFTLKGSQGWNINEVADSVVVQVRFKDITDPKDIENPRNWHIYITKSIDARRGWFNFRLTDARQSKSAFDIIKAAFNSF